MKTCPKCHEKIEDSFEVCQNCNYSFSDDKMLDMTPAEESDDNERSINCLRCQVKMVYSGKCESHEGMNMGIFGNLFELFQNRETLNLCVCPKYGKVEFFVPLDRGRELEVEQVGNDESVYKSRH